MSCRTEVGKLAGERAALLKKLVEVEMDGKAAGEQMIKLRDTVRRLKEVNLVCMFLHEILHNIDNKDVYHMTHTVPHTISLENHKKKGPV